MAVKGGLVIRAGAGNRRLMVGAFAPHPARRLADLSPQSRGGPGASTDARAENQWHDGRNGCEDGMVDLAWAERLTRCQPPGGGPSVRRSRTVHAVDPGRRAPVAGGAGRDS